MNASTKQRTELSGVERAYRERKVTLVFDEDAGVFKGNPFKIETPYGAAHALADAIEGRSKSDMDDAMKLYREMFETPA